MQQHLMLIIGEKPGKRPQALYIGRDPEAYQAVLDRFNADPDFEIITPFPFPQSAMVIYPARNAEQIEANKKAASEAETVILERHAAEMEIQHKLAIARLAVQQAESQYGLGRNRGADEDELKSLEQAITDAKAAVKAVEDQIAQAIVLRRAQEARAQTASRFMALKAQLEAVAVESEKHDAIIAALENPPPAPEAPAANPEQTFTP